MKSDQPDIEIYHQELLQNLKIHSSAMKQKRPKSLAFQDTAPTLDEDKEFIKNYTRGCSGRFNHSE